jgi:hypothetical protein
MDSGLFHLGHPPMILLPAGWNHQWSMETNNSWVGFSINSHHPWVGKAEKWHGRRLSTEPSSDHDPARRISLRTQAVQAAGAGKDDRQCQEWRAPKGKPKKPCGSVHVKCVCCWWFDGCNPAHRCSHTFSPGAREGSEFSLSKKSESQVNSHDLENYILL